MIKEMNEWVAYSRAKEADLLKMTEENAVTPLSKVAWHVQRKKYLISKYGEYKRIYPQKLEEINYLFFCLIDAGKEIIGFDLNEVGLSSNEWDENVGARCLFKLCNTLIASSQLYDAK
jgi:hypothetical protein